MAQRVQYGRWFRRRPWQTYFQVGCLIPSYILEFHSLPSHIGELLQEALAKTIRGYGVKEFSELVGLEPSVVQRAIDLKNNPTKATLERLLGPFGLTLGAKAADFLAMGIPSLNQPKLAREPILKCPWVG